MSSTVAKTPEAATKRTPLYDLHLQRGARMVAFAGYEMPVQFPLGTLKEHLHTRASAGLFDISHMGQIALSAKSGVFADAARALEELVPVDVLGLAAGRQRYALFTNGQGGIRDDIMIARAGDRLLLIVNAACKAADLAYVQEKLSDCCHVEHLDQALIALQGPKSAAVLSKLAPACADMHFMDVRELAIMGVPTIVTRSGYTGEDGFELSLPPDVAREIAEGLLENPDVEPIGLGARDSLRLEAGLCLYGSDIDMATSPVEAALAWAIQAVRRSAGARAGGFPGAAIILDQLQRGTSRRRVGLRPEGRAPVRGGALLFAEADGGSALGAVTSGGFGPSLGAPIAMAYVPIELATPGIRLFAEVRGSRLPVHVVTLPFIAPHYRRT